MNELEKLLKWFNDAGNTVRFTPLTQSPGKTVRDITDALAILSFNIKKDYPLLSERLFTLKNRLFMTNNFVNVSAFGRISEILIFLQTPMASRNKATGSAFTLPFEAQ